MNSLFRTTIRGCMVLVINLHSFSFFSQTPGYSFSKGEYVVGYKTLSLTDYGRPISVNPIQPRVLPVHIWYPAAKKGKKAMTFIEYVEGDKNFTWNNDSPYENLFKWIIQYSDSTVARQKTGQVSQIQTQSYKNAKPVSKKFPVIVLGNGLSTPGFMYSLLTEFLAGHGYVVISYPSLPENKAKGFSFDERGLLNQLCDLEFVIDQTSSMQIGDFSKMVMASWSIGGATQVLYQMKYKSAKAVISLDAASQYQYGFDLISKSVYYDSTAFQTPFLQITASGKAKYEVARNTYFYDALCLEKRTIQFPEFNHSQMLSFVELIGKEDDQPGYPANYKIGDVILSFLMEQLHQ